MKQQRILLRYSDNEYELSLPAARMLQKIRTANHPLQQTAALLGYMCEEFYGNGVSASMCNRWLRDTLYSMPGHTSLSSDQIDELVKQYSVDAFK